MRVGAAVAEGTHPRPTPLPRAHLPGHLLRVHPQGAAAEVKVLIAVPIVHTRHQLPVLQTQQHLVHPGHPGRRGAVPDVALHRPQRAALRAPSAVPEVLAQGLQLHRIPQLRARPMGLHIPNASRIDPVAFVHLPQQLPLRAHTRGGDPVGMSVLVHPRAQNHPHDPIPVRLRIRQALQHQRPHTLPRHKPIGLVVKGAAAPTSREHPRRAHLHIPLRAQVHTHPAHQGHLNLPAAQPLTPQVQRHQRGGAGRVDRQRRSLEVQVIRNAPRSNRRTRAGRVSGLLRGLLLANLRVLAAHDPQVHSAALLAQALRAVSGILEGVIALLQNQPLLRVHPLRLGRGDVEKQRIKTLHLLQRPQPLAVHLTHTGPRSRVVILHWPAARRHLLDTVAPRAQVLPVLLQVRSLRVASRHPDDRDRTLGARCGRQPRQLQRPQRGWRSRCGHRPPRRGGTLLPQPPPQLLHRRVLVQPRRTHAHPKLPVQAAHPLHPNHRIQPQLRERPIRTDLLTRQVQRLTQAVSNRTHHRLNSRTARHTGQRPLKPPNHRLDRHHRRTLRHRLPQHPVPLTRKRIRRQRNTARRSCAKQHFQRKLVPFRVEFRDGGQTRNVAAGVSFPVVEADQQIARELHQSALPGNLRLSRGHKQAGSVFSLQGLGQTQSQLRMVSSHNRDSMGKVLAAEEKRAADATELGCAPRSIDCAPMQVRQSAPQPCSRFGRQHE